MADGIRIRPREGIVWPDSAMIAVTDHARPIPPPADGSPIERWIDVCALCRHSGGGENRHFAKTYHIQLRAGTAIVSTEVWANLQRLADNPFEKVNIVTAPPAQGVAPWTNRPVELIEKFVMPIRTN
jgi:hypothetical protein